MEAYIEKLHVAAGLTPEEIEQAKANPGRARPEPGSRCLR